VWAVLPPLEPVPAGPFLRGSERGDEDALPDEFTVERRVTLPAYSMGRYPVTNGEFARFVEDGGYRDDHWWGEAGRAWKRGGPDAHAGAIEAWMGTRALVQGMDPEALRASWPYRPQDLRSWLEMAGLSDEQALERARRLFDRPFDRPAYWDDRELSSPARPVVGVNWHEADAYCRWLSAVTPGSFRLPAESDWEKGVRGADGGRFPWGEAFDADLCNTLEGHVHTPTPVGLYAGGVSPFGLFDGAGNVWEWTADWYEMYPGGEEREDFGERFRAVRGGSWFNDLRSARCAFRLRSSPDDFYPNLGFRVVSPGSSSGC
jgi:formylglycine-generating enzyme required for sulfatase activity